MTSPYFQNYGNAVESKLIEDLYNEAIAIQGFPGYYLQNTNTASRDLIYGDDPIKAFDTSYKLDMYLVNTFDYGDEQDFFSKFGLEVRNQVKIQFTVREFSKQTLKTMARPLEGDLIFIPFMKDTGELFEIKFVNSSKDLYTLGRSKPYFYELSLEPFKYNEENIDTGVAAIDNIGLLEKFKTDLDLISGSGQYIINEMVYQGSANNHIAYAEIIDWDSANTILTVINDIGEFDPASSLPIVGATSNAIYYLTSTNNSEQPNFDNDFIHDEGLTFIQASDNPFGSL